RYYPLLREEFLDCFGMAERDQRLRVGEPARTRSPIGECPRISRCLAKNGAIGFAVGKRAGRAELDDPLPVGCDQRHVDAVERSAAHQADRASCLRHPGKSLAAAVITCADSRDKSPPETGTRLNPIASMSTFRSDFLRTLQERGFIHQCSDPEGLDAVAAKG